MFHLFDKNHIKKLLNISKFSFLIILVFTGIFHLFDHNHFNGFGEKEDEEKKLINRLYFTMTTFSSTGYGDISPKTNEVKIIAMILQFILVVSIISSFA